MPLSDFKEGKWSQERNGAKGLGGFGGGGVLGERNR